MPRASNPLDIRACITQVQEALVEVIDLAYRRRYPEAADLVALAAYDAVKLPDRALVFCASEGVVYRWLTASRIPAAPPYVVVPNVLPAQGNGRWVQQSSSVTLGPDHRRPLHRVRTGYARAVQIYQGEDDEALERVYAQRPCFLVEWVSDDFGLKSYRHGCIYECEWKFSVHALSKNLRRGPDAVVGSAVAADAGIPPDPGLYQMLGDLRYLLGGCDLGLAPGVKFCDVTGAARIVESDLAQSIFRAELELSVKGSVHVVDEDLIPNPQIWIDRRDAGTPAGEDFDASNFVAQGLAVSPGPGLTATVTPGVAYIAGQVVSASAVARLFDADADTYRDLSPDGSLSFYAVETDSDPPPQMPNTLRVGLTRTDGTDVVADRYLCSSSVPSGANPGDPFRAA